MAVSRDCFPESLSVGRREALVKAYHEAFDAEDIYECPICIVESEIHMVQALEDIKRRAVMHYVYILAISGRRFQRRFWQSTLRDQRCLLRLRKKRRAI